jgi:hypothetical protein
MQRIVWTSDQWDLLHEHFLDAKHRETGAFLLLVSVQTHTGIRLLVQQVLLPPTGALEVQGRCCVLWSMALCRHQRCDQPHGLILSIHIQIRSIL